MTAEYLKLYVNKYSLLGMDQVTLERAPILVHPSQDNMGIGCQMTTPYSSKDRRQLAKYKSLASIIFKGLPTENQNIGVENKSNLTKHIYFP